MSTRSVIILLSCWVGLCDFCFVLCDAAAEDSATPSAPAATTAAPASPGVTPVVVPGAPMFDAEQKNLPTLITAQSLTLFTAEHRFVYSGAVTVKQGEMTLTSNSLEGNYDDNNKILTMTAVKDVVITKTDLKTNEVTLKASGQRAHYEAKTDMMTLTETPQVEQDGSILTADTIHVNMKDNHSTAEGNVRVTLVNKDKDVGVKKTERALKNG